MKSQILTALVVTSLLLSCSDRQTIDENQSGREVSFKTALGKVTRGTDNSRTTLENSSDGIGLYAYRGTSGFLGNGSTDATILANNKMVYEAAAWVIKDAADQPIKLYWPDLGSNEKLSFFAYFPRNASGMSNLQPIVIGSTAVPTFVFTVDNNVASQVDLLVARWVNPNSQPSNTVAFNFNHAMTKIAFAARTDVPDWEVTINSIQIQNVYNQATYTYPTKIGALDQTERNATWSDFSGNANYTLPLGALTVFDNTTNGGNFNVITSQAVGQSAFLLSQDLGANPNTPQLIINYSVVNKATSQFVFQNATKVFNIGNMNTNSSDDLPTIWNRGSMVTYKYTFTNASSGPGSEIVFTVDVNGWSQVEYSLD